MLAMHYAIPLSGADQVSDVRKRAAERGPWFDGMAGLTAKLFLVDPVDPCYATFYLWSDPDSALDFLQGEFFKALSETFGRPDVKLLLTRATELPFKSDEKVSFQVSAADSESIVRALDPVHGDIFSLGPASSPGRQFDVMYRAVGKIA